MARDNPPLYVCNILARNEMITIYAAWIHFLFIHVTRIQADTALIQVSYASRIYGISTYVITVLMIKLFEVPITCSSVVVPWLHAHVVFRSSGQFKNCARADGAVEGRGQLYRTAPYYILVHLPISTDQLPPLPRRNRYLCECVLLRCLDRV
jgi:hypothetical protein